MASKETKSDFVVQYDKIDVEKLHFSESTLGKSGSFSSTIKYQMGGKEEEFMIEGPPVPDYGISRLDESDEKRFSEISQLKEKLEIEGYKITFFRRSFFVIENKNPNFLGVKYILVSSRTSGELYILGYKELCPRGEWKTPGVNIESIETGDYGRCFGVVCFYCDA